MSAQRGTQQTALPTDRRSAGNGAEKRAAFEEIWNDWPEACLWGAARPWQRLFVCPARESRSASLFQGALMGRNGGVSRLRWRLALCSSGCLYLSILPMDFLHLYLGTHLKYMNCQLLPPVMAEITYLCTGNQARLTSPLPPSLSELSSSLSLPLRSCCGVAVLPPPEGLAVPCCSQPCPAPRCSEVGCQGKHQLL